MHFTKDFRYTNMTRQQCYALHKNENYQTAIANHALTTRTCLKSFALENGGVCREAEFIYEREVPTRLGKFLHGPKIGHIETSVYNGPQGGTWAIKGYRPASIAQYVHGAGTVDFFQDGPDVIRRVEGDIHVEMPLLRQVAEPVIQKFVIQGLSRAQAYTPTWIQDNPTIVSEIFSDP